MIFFFNNCAVYCIDFILLQMILFPIYFVVLLVVLKVSVYRPTNYSSMSNEETLNFQEIASNFSVTANQILIAPNNSGVIE